MASVVIAGDVSGTCTLQAANAAGTTVLSLPTTSGTLVSTGDSPSFVTVNATNVIASANSNAAVFTSGLGNAAAPSITFTGDTNTGIFSPGADTIAFTEGGSERMRITSTGKVGIGTTNPSGDFTVSNGGANGFEINPTEGSGASTKVNSFNRSTSAYTTLQFDALDFRVATGSSATERMRITSGGDLQFNSGYGSVATAYGCRAWVNFDGTGTIAIRASGNVSSITDNGTGAYAVNFTTAMPDANYGANISVSGNPGLSDANFCTTDMNGGSRANPTTTVFSFSAYRFQAPVIDVEFARVSIFR